MRKWAAELYLVWKLYPWDHHFSWNEYLKELHFQLGKVRGRFYHWSHAGWRFDDWNRWRQEDGLLCRSNNDCQWLDPHLECDDYKLDWSVASDWFSGDTGAIVGTCDCVAGLWWSDDHIQCMVSRLVIISMLCYIHILEQEGAFLNLISKDLRFIFIQLS